jgi:hypothetical protein
VREHGRWFIDDISATGSSAGLRLGERAATQWSDF